MIWFIFIEFFMMNLAAKVYKISIGFVFSSCLFVQKELDVRGSRNAMPEDFRAVMEYMKKKTFPKEEIISGIYPPEKAQEVLETWAANPGRIFRLLIEF